MRAPDKIQAEGFIPYKYVILPYVFQEDTYVSAIEIRPHNRNVVHHCNMAYVNIAKMKGGDDTFITGYVPGGQPMDLRPKTASDPEVAYKIPKGSSLVLQIHYTTTGKEEQSLDFRRLPLPSKRRRQDHAPLCPGPTQHRDRTQGPHVETVGKEDDSRRTRRSWACSRICTSAAVT